MSSQPELRAAMVPVSRYVRAYFAPMDRALGTPAIFDPGKYGMFNLDSPPSPWLDLGWIDNFRRVSATRAEALRSGPRGDAAAQFRGSLDTRMEFDFREWGKLQMALAGGSQHMNVLATETSADPRPSGGTAVSAVAVLPGSSATEIVFGVGAVDFCAVGDILAIDADYQQQAGYVGTGISAAYISDPASVQHDVDYVRRVTFNLGRVAEKTATSALLAQPLLGGAPPAQAGAQKVVALVDRDGGSFFQDWSALFVLQEESGGRVCFYFPHLSPGSGEPPAWLKQPQSQAALSSAEVAVEIAAPLSAFGLHAAFAALPFQDVNDSEFAACYRSYFPAGAASLY